jgi:hypothetical protein
VLDALIFSAVAPDKLLGRDREFADSLLEGDGFELLVPHALTADSAAVVTPPDLPVSGDSNGLQRSIGFVLPKELTPNSGPKPSLSSGKNRADSQSPSAAHDHTIQTGRVSTHLLGRAM